VAATATARGNAPRPRKVNKTIPLTVSISGRISGRSSRRKLPLPVCAKCRLSVSGSSREVSSRGYRAFSRLPSARLTPPHALQSAPSRFAPFRLESRRPRPTPRRSLVRCSGASLLILAGNKCRLIRLRGNAGVPPAVHVRSRNVEESRKKCSGAERTVESRAAEFKGSQG